ncbi:MAG TPA: hypothetical protein K8W01_00710 [Methylorubrum populi]|uniref:DUF5330 domain-containing protein n=1 Tax=Methylorubrum populi TaxID=223967 RepID=A0A921DYZ5_9HYPH|nr:hypothetical protein [Methylorubrum populi]
MKAVMRAVPFVGLAVILLAPSAEARPARQHIPGSSHAVLAPLEEAATACFAETVMANAKAMRLAREGHWVEAASVIGFLCRPEVDRMAVAHDRIYGRGTGARYFKGAYALHLDKQLAARLQPQLELKTVASAEPPAEKAPPGDAGAEPFDGAGH